MKAKIIALVAITALSLSPVFGAPKKMDSSATGKRSSPAASNAEKTSGEKVSPAQAGARELVAELSTVQRSKILTLLNEGTPNDLTVIKGISNTRAAAIEKARPFESIDEVILVSGIGQKTVSEIVSHARNLTTTKKKPSAAASSVKEKETSAKEKETPSAKEKESSAREKNS